MIETFVLLVLAWGVAIVPPAFGADEPSRLAAVLNKVPAAEIMPGAQSYGEVNQTTQTVPLMAQDNIVGHGFLNTSFDSAIGYSGKPITVFIAMDLEGRISGAKLVEHSEPIVLAGIPDEKIVAFIEGYKDLNLIKSAGQASNTALPVDIVSGATVTVLVIDDSIRNSALRAARVLGLAGLSAAGSSPTVKRTVDTSSTKTSDWLALIGEGSVRRLKLNVQDVNDAFKAKGNPKAIERPEPGEPKDLFIELFAASLAVPAVAKSLLGEAEYANLKKRLKPGENVFLFMGNGPFSFKGSGYVRGGIFDRVQLVQNRSSIRFLDRGHKRLRKIYAEGAPAFREIGLFRTPADTKFDPASPWRLQLLVPRAVGALDKVFTSFELAYRLPDQYVKSEKIDEGPKPVPPVATATGALPKSDLWKRIWKQKTIQISILCAAIGFLTVLFFFQNVLVKYPRLTRWVRDGFLLFTVVWIGWYAQAQLSVVNVLVFANALIGNFQWEYFLLEPLIFILWCSVAASLLFWGRGAFCGWLCPFGALQELLNRVAKAVKIPQYRLPWSLHERLWPLKYLMFLGLLGFSVYSLADAERLAEVEPFKTAIVLRFVREWPFVVFALVLLGIGLFVERFYCRYLCPLGAALAIPGRLAMFDWLKRYRNCGDPCHLCAQDCMVQAITPLGDINPNECLHCMNCQVKYFDATVCPVMILKHAKSAKGGTESVDQAQLDSAKSMVRRPRRLGKSRTVEPDPSHQI
ncbi:MAG: regulatory protein NosR [Rhizobiales bacterium]|nr:regulatory protein NosR [Hyphomicrobiales bacterium]